MNEKGSSLIQSQQFKRKRWLCHPVHRNQDGIKQNKETEICSKRKDKIKHQKKINELEINNVPGKRFNK